MQHFLTLWNALGPRRRLVVGLATLGMFAGVVLLSRAAATPSMTLLYAGLEEAAAAEVIGALDARGVAYEVRGTSIFVAAPRRDELRMLLAGEGLPANSAKGYELLDSLSGFGTTSQMFDAAYWRAKEGELARTIQASPHVSSARVHIAQAGPSPFRRDVRPTASVSVSTTDGTLSAAQANALRHLVAAAVAGMAAEDVAVIDDRGRLIGSAEEAAPTLAGEDRAALLRARAERLLEARLGPGNAVVEVSVETVTQSEAIRERRFDPEQRIAISTESEARKTSSAGGGSGVTAASNLPDGDAAEAGRSTSQDSETRERINYEVSETQREILRAPGAVRRLSVAVLVNAAAAPEPSADEAAAEDPELGILRDLVASAVGLDPERGDVITVRSLPFEAMQPAGTPAPAARWIDGLDLMSLVQLAVAALVTLALGLLVVRPILRSAARDAAAPGGRLALGQTGAADTAAATAGPALTGEIDDGNETPDALPALRAPHTAPAAPDPVARLRNLIGERQEETVAILHSWLHEREEKA